MHLSRIILYPVKSLDGVEVKEARLTEGGALEHDRAYAIFDAGGGYVNGKRNDRVHRLRSAFFRGQAGNSPARGGSGTGTICLRRP